MSAPKKLIQLFAIAAFLIFVSFLRKLDAEERSHGRLKDRRHREVFLNTSTWLSPSYDVSGPEVHGMVDSGTYSVKANFHPGSPKPPGSAYTRVMIIPRMRSDDVSWIAHELPDTDVLVYVANDPKGPLHPPKNKGHEVMIYLTYIIDHYNDLPDIVIFMHAHRWTHHNNHLLGNDAVEMVRRLRSDHVTREGYVNMRCQWTPGCPEWLHPGNIHESLDKQEEEVLARCWKELFPSEPLPRALGQACCAQFALSKERILSIPLTRFVFYRDWIMRTPLSDYVSGRIWEYLWQFVFTGRHVVCPAEHSCYCDGFGVCFGGDAEYQDFELLRHKKQGYEEQLKELRERQVVLAKGYGENWNGNSSHGKAMDPARDAYLSAHVEALDREITARRLHALAQGQSPKNRAADSGRRWEETDGF
ncbi:hypothetical protein N7G274_009824 [Stereocaulon virgatum]|uniref:Uncharacterized protein n=1 Tax=Stereocaulon virgatum TaxID=373712 RepID=A0ABR3ZXT4_9LECA